jgi:hypothetical protein
MKYLAGKPLAIGVSLLAIPLANTNQGPDYIRSSRSFAFYLVLVSLLIPAPRGSGPVSK